MSESNDSELFERVFAFIRREVPPPCSSVLNPSTDLRKNLRMAEEDADELLKKIFKEFSIQNGDFDFSRYFPPEGLWIFFQLKKQPQPKPLTIGMLVQAVKKGVWDTPSIESRI